MRLYSNLVIIFIACAGMANAQMGRTTDWWSYGGDAQRSGWEKNEQKFTKSDVPNFQLLWRMKLENQQKGVRSLMPPLILGNLIGYRGFKELAFVAGSSDNLWVIDVDLAKMYWQKHFESSSTKTSSTNSSCPALLTAVPTLPAPIVFRFGRPAAAPGTTPPTPAGAAPVPVPPAPVPPAGPNPAATPGRQPGPPSSASTSAFEAITRVRPVYVVSSDGMLHRLNQANGEDLAPPISFLPANAKAHSLNISENVLYTTTTQGCGSVPNAVWGIDLSGPNPNVSSFVSDSGEIVGFGSPILGTNGAVYVQTDEQLLALTPKELKAKDRIVLPGSTTPLLFAYKGHDLVATAGKDGRIYLLDANSLGGDDHKTPLLQTEPVTVAGSKTANHGISGNLSTWEDTDGTRYILAAVSGPVNPELHAPSANGDAPNGSIVAFKLQEQDGKPALVPAWVSRDLSTPAPPVIAQGVVFALSNGQFTRKAKKSNGVTVVEERPAGSTHATLYAFDGVTGKELYSTGNQVTAPGSLTGLSIANGRLYFTTTDNTLNVFGKYLETETEP